MMKCIGGLRDIADQFDLYLVDQYGVLHDGVAVYAGAIDGLARINSSGCKVIVLTNSGKSASDNQVRLGALGFADSNFHAVVSSGEVGLQLVRSGAFGPRFTIGAEACVIGRSGDRYAFSSDDFNLVARPLDAAFLVFAGSDAPRTSLKAYRSMLKTAAQAGVPGAIAKVYENLGGPVEYVGKPHSAFFHHALTVAATGADARTVMIGDSPEHDVCGAKAMGFSTLLVRTGIHQSLAEPQLLSFCTACGGTPDFLAAAFKW
jgi:ribonucleotide monophosphatase NagD (HAD superfamily)